MFILKVTNKVTKLYASNTFSLDTICTISPRKSAVRLKIRDVDAMKVPSKIGSRGYRQTRSGYPRTIERIGLETRWVSKRANKTSRGENPRGIPGRDESPLPSDSERIMQYVCPIRRRRGSSNEPRALGFSPTNDRFQPLFFFFFFFLLRAVRRPIASRFFTNWPCQKNRDSSRLSTRVHLSKRFGHPPPFQTRT